MTTTNINDNDHDLLVVDDGDDVATCCYAFLDDGLMICKESTEDSRARIWCGTSIAGRSPRAKISGCIECLSPLRHSHSHRRSQAIHLKILETAKFVQKSCKTFLSFVASRALAPKAPAMRSFAKAFREDCRVQFRPRGPLRSLCNANVSIVSCPMQGLMVSQSWIRNRSLLDKEACLRPKKSRSKSFAPWLKI